MLCQYHSHSDLTYFRTCNPAARYSRSIDISFNAKCKNDIACLKSEKMHFRTIGTKDSPFRFIFFSLFTYSCEAKAWIIWKSTNRETYITTVNMNGFFKAFHRQQSKPLQLSYSAPRALLRLLSRLVFLRFFFAETVLKRCFVSMEAWEVKDQSGGVVQLQGSSHWQNLHLTCFTMGTVESNTAIGVLLGLLGLVIVLVFIRFCKCLKKIGTPRDGGDGEPLDVNNPPKQLNIQLALHQAATQTFQPALVNPH